MHRNGFRSYVVHGPLPEMGQLGRSRGEGSVSGECAHALAYGNATRPPLEVRPESNVTVLYCPWYWNSRTTSATSWANPLNITAMKEFTSWAMAFPGQMGLYDYPDSWVHGRAERLKFLAKRGAKVFYACGGNGDLYQWVGARLLWDPWLNTEDLVEEFVQAYYGPAARPMGEYLRGKQQMIENVWSTRVNPFGDAGFLQKSAELLGSQTRRPAWQMTGPKCGSSPASPTNTL